MHLIFEDMIFWRVYLVFLKNMLGRLAALYLRIFPVLLQNISRIFENQVTGKAPHS